ncbi:uncharacterized protein LOC125755686 [Canis lupus dingo]|uniref:uncharacterized protein LOC119875697 n=1 Tax=Canis lupus familiaris TaxID=9615 RepID=UPI0018F7E26E|nr:uncharacterized protein LOC119875697 [Canis lupus familiaris]XP_048969739.1 uncharacterized protein LOC125755686 [Canis lupus dingo]
MEKSFFQIGLWQRLSTLVAHRNLLGLHLNQTPVPARPRSNRIGVSGVGPRLLYFPTCQTFLLHGGREATGILSGFSLLPGPSPALASAKTGPHPAPRLSPSPREPNFDATRGRRRDGGSRCCPRTSARALAVTVPGSPESKGPSRRGWPAPRQGRTHREGTRAHDRPRQIAVCRRLGSNVRQPGRLSPQPTRVVPGDLSSRSADPSRHLASRFFPPSALRFSRSKYLNPGTSSKCQAGTAHWLSYPSVTSNASPTGSGLPRLLVLLALALSKTQQLKMFVAYGVVELQKNPSLGYGHLHI